MKTKLIIALLGSLLRHFSPAATAYLAGQGISLIGGVSPVFTIVLAIVVYLVMQLISMARQWLKHRPG